MPWVRKGRIERKVQSEVIVGRVRIVRRVTALATYPCTMNATQFPIESLLPQVLTSLQAHPRLLLEAPPGAGKTTQVPPALLHAPWRGDGRIIMLEPRRVAARAAAGFMAGSRGEAVGNTVGYRIRFENKVSAATRIEVVTEIGRAHV